MAATQNLNDYLEKGEQLLGKLKHYKNVSIDILFILIILFNPNNYNIYNQYFYTNLYLAQ